MPGGLAGRLWVVEQVRKGVWLGWGGCCGWGLGSGGGRSEVHHCCLCVSVRSADCLLRCRPYFPRARRPPRPRAPLLPGDVPPPPRFSPKLLAPLHLLLHDQLSRLPPCFSCFWYSVLILIDSFLFQCPSKQLFPSLQYSPFVWKR
jgi:hypothetical protein